MKIGWMAWLGVALAPGVGLAADGRAQNEAPVPEWAEQIGTLERRLESLKARLEPTSNAKPDSSTLELSGQVESMAGERLWLRDRYGNLFRLTVRQDVAGLERIRQGAPVRVTAELEGDEQIITKLEHVRLDAER